MQAGQTSMLHLLQQPNQQFVIPVYQRTYKWSKVHCTQLLQDIIRVGNSSNKTHFIGSVVYITDKQYPATKVKPLTIIDGQQRVTTISLLLLAMCNYLKDNPNKCATTSLEIFNQYLVNQHKRDEDYIKLQLTKHDKGIYNGLMLNPDIEGDYHNILNNFNFMLDFIKDEKVDLDRLYEGIAKLMIVEVLLEREYDDPQLIFESLNSTGSKLTQADLIRNYLLMDLRPSFQSKVYNNYWFLIEQKLREEKGELSDFIRDYLTVKTKRIPNKSLVYEEFKAFFTAKHSREHEDIEALMRDLMLYAKYYERIIRHIEPDVMINEYLVDLEQLEVKVAYPLLLILFKDHEEGILSKEDFIHILALIRSFIVRRLIVGAPSNAVSKVLMSIAKDVEKNIYVYSVEKILISKKGNQRFPNDDEFRKAFIVKDIYNLSNKNRKHIIHKLENYNSKEILNIDSFTIEHIMPQTKNLSEKWKKALGENWREVHNTYLHTIGNLTLTKYNSEMSNKCFIEKRDLEGGFRDSPARLNKGLKELDNWNENEIIKRAKSLRDFAISVWKFPQYVSIHSEDDYKPILTFEDEWTNKKPIAFEFLAQRIDVKDFTQLYLKVINIIYDLDPETFIEVIHKEEFLTRKFCSENEEDFSYQSCLSNSHIYINTNLSSEMKRRNLLLLFEKMELDEDDLIIYLE